MRVPITRILVFGGIYIYILYIYIYIIGVRLSWDKWPCLVRRSLVFRSPTWQCPSRNGNKIGKGGRWSRGLGFRVLAVARTGQAFLELVVDDVSSFVWCSTGNSVATDKWAHSYRFLTLRTALEV